MRKYSVGVLGATGMVGQRFVTLLASHPWFTISVLGASEQSAGKTYREAVRNRWMLSDTLPENVSETKVLDVLKDAETITSEVDFVFCALNMPKSEIMALEEKYAKLECPVISNNSAHRKTTDVPMVIPEINSEHLALIESQRTRLGTKRGFIAVKSNCSLQSYVPALHPLRKFGLERVLVCTCQAISGAGKTFSTWPEMVDNCIPYISGEEEKSEQEPMKLWGTVHNGRLIEATAPLITAQCIRVPCSDGHLATCFIKFSPEQKPSIETLRNEWSIYHSPIEKLALPSAPRKFLHYLEETDRPQTRMDRMIECGMGIAIGRLRHDSQYDYKFNCLSHNTIRGAAGGAILLAELLCSQGYI